MKAEGRYRLLLAALLTVCLLAILLASCSEKGGGTRRPNIPPETFISFGPSEDSLTYYKVQVFWYGADVDGRIESFLINTVEDVDRTAYSPGFDWDSIEGWGETTSKETTFVLRADSCCVAGSQVKTASALWGVLVRAVDNSGLVSEEPAMLFFKAANVLPDVEITVPFAPAGVRPPLTGHPFFAWRGNDPDGAMSAIEYKYISVVDDDADPLTPQSLPPLSYEDSAGAYTAPQIGMWSQWVEADCTSVKDVDLELYAPEPGDAGTNYVWFCVAAKDEGDAITPESRYAKLVGAMVDVGAGVQIFIDGGALGIRDSKDPSDAAMVAGIFTGNEISFRFWGNERKSQGQIAEAFRYYWDSPADPTSVWNFWTGVEPFREPGATPEWSILYPRDGSVFEPSLGNHILYVEVRDVNRTTTRCLFRLEVLPGPSRLEERKVLLVDDNEALWLPKRWIDFEASEDAFWADVLEGYPLEIVDTGRDHSRRDVDIRQANSATTVIWSADDVLNLTDTQLYKLIAEKSNYLDSYVKVGGNLILIGKDVVFSTMYWPDGTIWKGMNSESGGDLRRPFPPERRSAMDSWDFTPLGPEMTESGDSVFNWNWEIFGIKRMAFSSSPVRPLNGMISCAACDPAFSDSILTIEPPAVTRFSGEFGNMAYINELRDDMYIRPLFAGGLYDSTTGQWTNYGDDWLVGLYVPATGGRGHAAYIGVPVYWFEHDKIKSLIRHLLTEFGEQPQGF